MKHFTDSSFWNAYDCLPKSVKQIADKNFDLLKDNQDHPSLYFKKLSKGFWSVRVGRNYRALAIEMDDGNLVWFWIGSHTQYDKLVKK